MCNSCIYSPIFNEKEELTNEEYDNRQIYIVKNYGINQILKSSKNYEFLKKIYEEEKFKLIQLKNLKNI